MNYFYPAIAINTEKSKIRAITLRVAFGSHDSSPSDHTKKNLSIWYHTVPKIKRIKLYCQKHNLISFFGRAKAKPDERF